MCRTRCQFQVTEQKLSSVSSLQAQFTVNKLAVVPSTLNALWISDKLINGMNDVMTGLMTWADCLTV